MTVNRKNCKNLLQRSAKKTCKYVKVKAKKDFTTKNYQVWNKVCFGNPQKTLIPGNDKVKSYETRSVFVPSTLRCSGVLEHQGKENVANTREHKCKKAKHQNKNLYDNSTKWAIFLFYNQLRRFPVTNSNLAYFLNRVLNTPGPK